MKRTRGGQWLFWVVLVLSLLKFYLYLFAGAVLWVWVAPWLLWVMLIVWLMVLLQLWRIWYWGATWGSLSAGILTLIVLVGIGFATRSARWTGEWRWRSVAGPSNVPALGTTDQGENLIACESDPDGAVTPAPAGITAMMFSAPYVPTAEGKKASYSETSGYPVSTFSYDRLNAKHVTGEPYTAAETPEGDVFFTVRGAGGFSAGYDFAIQVCSTDGKMLAKEALGDGLPRSSEQASGVTAITEYLWQNRRVWGPGQYRAYGYVFDKDKQWKLIARSDIFTVK